MPGRLHKLSLFSLISLAGLTASALYAHEFWLEPRQYRLNKGDAFVVDARVGQFFKGTEMPYLPKYFERFEVHNAQGGRNVASRLGDMPAVEETLQVEGLNTIAFVSKPSVISYDTLDDFASFVENHDLSWAIKRHQARGLNDKDISEAYVRHSKALVQVGEAQKKDVDKRLGFLFEWVLQENPYVGASNALPAVLYWQGKPYAGAKVHLFIDPAQAGEGLIEKILYTDAQGKAQIPAQVKGQYLLNAVQIVEADDALRKSHGAVWLSHWASMTFAID